DGTFHLSEQTAPQKFDYGLLPTGNVLDGYFLLYPNPWNSKEQGHPPYEYSSQVNSETNEVIDNYVIDARYETFKFEETIASWFQGSEEMTLSLNQMTADRRFPGQFAFKYKAGPMPLNSQLPDFTQSRDVNGSFPLQCQA